MPPPRRPWVIAPNCRALEILIHRADDLVQPRPILGDGFENHRTAVPPDANVIGIETDTLGEQDDL